MDEVFLQEAKVETQDFHRCAICLEIMEPKGRERPLFYNGCCGNALHFSCYQRCLNSNITKCPSCLARFSVFVPLNYRLNNPPTPPTTGNGGNLEYML